MYGTPDAPGIVPRITEDLFSLIAGKKVCCVTIQQISFLGV
uniref:Kinesin-like protein n=1 Tax=Mesocestoides corti TaxID=53468 RepID=A0A5K3FLU2_MESCO